ncbi:MAG: hypothetical protein KHW81_02535 [[Clostridium] innocuum]|nr:hypothetical protein [[Clostridium] innocuum]
MIKKVWINKIIDINFEVPASIKEFMEILDSLNDAQDYCYFDYADLLDNTAKELVVRCVLSKKQWDTLNEKYGGADYDIYIRYKDI